jgi:hypothetical protein|tara:strand:- start:198 stop:572 length:375 start_codon:yes stop_codon:yes gene_type:complete
MITITLNNLNNLNTSLQVGDLIYTVATSASAPEDLQSISTTGVNQLVGILRRITNAGTTTILDIDETTLPNTVVPMAGDFLMFSKYDQTDGDVNGYYAKATFINNSKEKAELFAVSSEIVINSK